jgi:hypothetical protein
MQGRCKLRRHCKETPKLRELAASYSFVREDESRSVVVVPIGRGQTMSNAAKKEMKVFCRQCGGERYHSTIAEKVDAWSEEDTPICGAEAWAIVECCGCRTLTFLHERWFSEDTVDTDHGPEPIIHRTIYPPSPARKLPEWSNDQMFMLLEVPVDDTWVLKLHQDVYAAIELRSLRLSAMGVRAIVDHIVTRKARDVGTFLDRLGRLRDLNLIDPSQVNVIFSAFDAGSAAVHRGYGPELQHVYTMLDIAEALILQFYVEPAMAKRRETAAAELKKSTPPRRNP